MDAAFYDWCRARVAAGELIEDERIADWQFLTPMSAESSALVIGAGAGTAALALARACRHVVVVDGDSGRLGVVAARARSQEIHNIETRSVSVHRAAPAGTFDVAACRAVDCGEAPLTLGDAIALAAAGLRPDGVLSLTVDNAWSFARLLQPAREPKVPAWSGRRCEAELRAAGFIVTSLHAVLPSAAAPPLFWVPLRPHSAFGFFLRDLAGLLDLASPEAKSSFARLRRVASFGVRAAVTLGAARAAAQFVPAFGVIARRAGR